MTDTYQPGVYIDFTSKTVCLCGAEIVDRVFSCMEGKVTPERVMFTANTILALKYPDYDRGDESWSLGADEPTLEHFKLALGDDFVINSFVTDGGR